MSPSRKIQGIREEAKTEPFASRSGNRDIAGIKVFVPNGTVYSATKFAVRALSEGLRAEAGASIRSTIISPGAVESELKEGSTDPDAVKAVGEFYRANQIPAESVARAIAYAIEQPFDVDINEIVLRPTSQEF